MMAVFNTAPSPDVNSPVFAELFTVAVPEGKLSSKTLQVHVWCVLPNRQEECLVRKHSPDPYRK